MYKITTFALIIFSFLIMSSCAGGTATGGEEGNYETTKKMVVDILKTDEGKKTLTDVLSKKEMQKKFVIESAVVKDAVSKALTSEKGKQFWSKMFEDPKFVEAFAKTVQDEQKKMMKDLMNDSEYQKQMLELLQNPQMSEQILSVLKGQEFRAHLEKAIQESLNTPLFKAKMSEIVLKAAEEMKQSKGGQGGQGGESGSGGQGGGSGSGEGGNSGGGNGGGP